MVLIDTTPPASGPGPAVASSDRRDSYNAVGRVAALASATARLGVARLQSQFTSGDLPSQAEGEVRAATSTAANFGSFVEEFARGNASAQQAASFVDFADKPLVVLTAGVGSDPSDAAAHAHLATLSTNGVHRVVEGETHQSLVAAEGGAAATTRAIVDVVSSARSGNQLTE